MTMVFSYGTIRNIRGIIAQLVEHMPYKHGVIGSSPIGSTRLPTVIVYERSYLSTAKIA